ncbi:hypothetical protein AC579_7121 [Pseudocercospora musae]|uniref:Uncharacterized protein n=1 Tax=Pseudocercospora musae TaxID=113226 RepID=A0A139IN39_9PEZI|nr:hypothetical protein AC579_7121 [Pseudocercospora musae]
MQFSILSILCLASGALAWFQKAVTSESASEMELINPKEVSIAVKQTPVLSKEMDVNRLTALQRTVRREVSMQYVPYMEVAMIFGSEG